MLSETQDMLNTRGFSLPYLGFFSGSRPRSFQVLSSRFRQGGLSPSDLTEEERKLARALWDSLQHGDVGAMEALEKAPARVRSAILRLWKNLDRKDQPNPFD